MLTARAQLPYRLTRRLPVWQTTNTHKYPQIALPDQHQPPPEWLSTRHRAEFTISPISDGLLTRVVGFPARLVAWQKSCRMPSRASGCDCHVSGGIYPCTLHPPSPVPHPRSIPCLPVQTTLSFPHHFRCSHCCHSHCSHHSLAALDAHSPLEPVASQLRSSIMPAWTPADPYRIA